MSIQGKLIPKDSIFLEFVGELEKAKPDDGNDCYLTAMCAFKKSFKGLLKRPFEGPFKAL